MMTGKHFGKILKAVRNERSLTLRALAKQSGVNHANIASFESGRRRCGMACALKLADTLGLFGYRRAEFLGAAAAGFRGSGLQLDQHYPQELYLLVDSALGRAGIKPADIASVVGEDCRVKVVLKGGQDAVVEVRVKAGA